jgi:hypothetical protein
LAKFYPVGALSAQRVFGAFDGRDLPGPSPESDTDIAAQATDLAASCWKVI